MSTQTSITNEAGTAVPVRRQIGRTGRVALSWAMAGGIGLGGVAVSLMTLMGRMSANALMLTTTGLFIVGAVLGFAHGAVLGAFGRNEGRTRSDAVRSLGKGALYAIPGLAVAWLAASWISMTVVARYTATIPAYAGAAVGWIGGAMVLAWATVEGVKALRMAYSRWPEWQLGTAVVSLSFAALLVIFLSDRPELWGTRLRVTETGAVLMAAVSALWIVGPMTTVGMIALKKIAPPHTLSDSFESKGALLDLALALGAGTAIGLLSAPFLAGTAATSAMAQGTLGTLAVALSQAMVNEVLLRLFVMTGVAWLILSWGRASKEEAILTAVVAAALMEVLLHLPGILNAGFPGQLATVSYLLTAVMIPGLVFGALYYLRGFRAAVLTHAASVVALAVVLL
jgi:hypothetical protein